MYKPFVACFDTKSRFLREGAKGVENHQCPVNFSVKDINPMI